jgi:hypothetical protein
VRPNFNPRPFDPKDPWAFDVSPGTLRDLEQGAVPRGWTEAQGVDTRRRRFYAYNSMNRCCRAWMLLGWPDDGRGHPQGSMGKDAPITKGFRIRGNAQERILVVECPKCSRDLNFDLARPDLVEERKKEGPPAIVGGRIKKGGR